MLPHSRTPQVSLTWASLRNSKSFWQLGKTTQGYGLDQLFEPALAMGSSDGAAASRHKRF
jgi:hypothetical protein